MNITTTTITPEMAKAMLEKNIRNRNLNARRVTHLANQMRDGRWKFNGDTICINGEQLIDGQHRLAAIIESGTPIPAILVEGLPSDVFDTKDTGKPRTGADTLSAKGEINCTLLAGALGHIHRYLTGTVFRSQELLTNQLIEELLAQHPAIRRSVHLCQKTRKLISPSMLSACHYLFSQKDQNAADQFVRDLVAGDSLHNRDGVYWLRERLMQNTLAKAKLRTEYIFALTIKAWNARRACQPVGVLRYNGEGKTPEPFPMVQ